MPPAYDARIGRTGTLSLPYDSARMFRQARPLSVVCTDWSRHPRMTYWMSTEVI